jgi:hypothetical protein
LFGDGFVMLVLMPGQDLCRRVLTVQSSAMSRKKKARDLFDRRILLLISSGLVKGITPTSIRTELGAAIPDFVSSWPDGKSAAKQKKDC